MVATTPDEIDTLFAKALNAADLDALMSLYETDASLMPSPGNVVVGKVAIRQALAGLIAAKPTMTLNARTLSQTGDLALVTAQWQVAMTDAEGKPVTMNG